MIYPKIRMEHQVTEAYLLLQTKEKELLTVMFNAQLFEEEMIIDCFIEFAGEKTHYFNGGMIARRRTVRM